MGLTRPILKYSLLWRDYNMVLVLTMHHFYGKNLESQSLIRNWQEECRVLDFRDSFRERFVVRRILSSLLVLNLLIFQCR